MLIERKLPIPAYQHLLKLSHCFNVLDARGAIGVTQRAKCFATMRRLAKGIAGVHFFCSVPKRHTANSYLNIMWELGCQSHFRHPAELICIAIKRPVVKLISVGQGPMRDHLWCRALAGKASRAGTSLGCCPITVPQPAWGSKLHN